MKSSIYQPAEVSRELKQDFLIHALAKHTGHAPVDGVVSCSYKILRSTANGLEYSDPMSPGSAAFYSWLSAFDWYYPSSRWEYREVEQFVSKRAQLNGRASIADVGCGSGKFLSRFLNDPKISAFGIETDYAACVTSRKRGLNVFNGLTTDYLRQNPAHPLFDVVSAFHVLEHVSDPVAFVRELLELTATEGMICISTPLSPMFFECVWFDVLNHPPHHLTRWTTSAYSDLAKELGLSVRFQFPTEVPLFSQIIASCQLVRFGPWRNSGRLKTLVAMVRNPWETLRITLALLAQRKRLPETKWDSVLVVFTRPSAA